MTNRGIAPDRHPIHLEDHQLARNNKRRLAAVRDSLTRLGCGLRRAELTELTLAHLQRRKEHWAIVDLVGKGGHIRTVPVPDWVKPAIDEWLLTARVTEDKTKPSVESAVPQSSGGTKCAKK